MPGFYFYYMNGIIDWFKESNRWKHLLGGFIIGILSNDWYCTILAGFGVAGALEFKDYQYGGKPDWIDFMLTGCGAIAGFGLRSLVCRL